MWFDNWALSKNNRSGEDQVGGKRSKVLSKIGVGMWSGECRLIESSTLAIPFSSFQTQT